MIKIKLFIFVTTCILCLETCNSHSSYNKNTFKYNQSVGISSLDPAFSKDLATMWACSHIYESLFILDQNTELKPLLIKNYTLSSDKLTYRFYLKKGIEFHRNKCFQSTNHTRTLKSEDVIYSLKRLIDPKTASPGAWVLNKKLDSLHPFNIIDLTTFEIKLSKPNAQFLQVLSMPYCSVVAKEAVEYYGSKFRKNPVGTGPFQFKIWDDGTVLFLDKNKHYHQSDSQGKALPYLDYVKITFNENKKTELLSFEKKDLSFITGLDGAVIQDVFDPNGDLNPKWKSKSKLSKKPFLNTEYMAILMDNKLLSANSSLKSKAIRKAINHAINRDELVKYLKNNLVNPANKGFVSLGMPNYDTSFNGREFNPILVQKLIAEAGFSSHNKPKLELHIDSRFAEMADFIANQLQQNGFDIKIKLHPADMMMQLAVDGKAELFRRSWMADYPDAENYFSCFYSKNTCPPNYTRFSNKVFDRLYEQITEESNPKLRRNLYKKLEQILIEESPIVPIFYDQSIRLIQPNVTGLDQNVLNTLDLRKVRAL